MARFSRENCREMAARSLASRKRNQAEREAMRNIAPSVLPVASAGEADIYLMQRISRTRGHLARLDGLLEKETCPKALDKLSAAIARLSEVERVLAMRPSPPRAKPSRDTRKDRAGTSEPLD